MGAATAETAERDCPGCGRPVAVAPPPDDLAEPWRGFLERLTPLCAECEAGLEDEERAEVARRLADAARRRVRESGLPRALRGLAWDSLERDHERERAVAAARRWARLEGPPGLYLHGPVGTGKTRLAATAANERLLRGDPLAWASMPVLLARATTDAKRDQASEILTGGRRTLCLDDVTKVGGSRWAASQLYAAVDSRLSEGAGLLLTSNVRPSELPRVVGPEFGESLASRVAEACAVAELGGRDRRLRA